MPEQEPSRPTPENWHAARSKLVDSFAALESALGAVLSLAQIKTNGETLGQKIEKLRNAKPGPHYSKARKQKDSALLTQVESLLDIRNTIVHAQLKLARFESATEAVFINPRCIAAGRRNGILLDYDEFAKLTREATGLAKALVAPVASNPASSRPPPLPGAAGGP